MASFNANCWPTKSLKLLDGPDDICATEPVDRLFGVTYDEQRARNGTTISPIRFVGFVRRQIHHNLRLDRIGILELINAEVCKPMAEITTDRRLVSKQPGGSHQ